MLLSLPYEESGEKEKAGSRKSFFTEKVLEMPADTFPLITLEAISQGSY